MADAHTFTVGDLIDRGLTAFWKCQGCGATAELDLARVGRERGRDATLMNRHPPCRRCPDGRVFFYVRGGLAVKRQTTPEAERQALRADGERVGRELRAAGYSKVDGRWVKPDRASRER